MRLRCAAADRGTVYSCSNIRPLVDVLDETLIIVYLLVYFTNEVGLGDRHLVCIPGLTQVKHTGGN